MEYKQVYYEVKSDIGVKVLLPSFGEDWITSPGLIVTWRSKYDRDGARDITPLDCKTVFSPDINALIREAIRIIDQKVKELGG